jgi:DNA-binding response OmpR family regulator
MSKTALIVEDEIFVALDLERILTDAGYSVCAIAADSEAARAAAPSADFALVDVNLRDGCTGPAIARELSASGVKVVFVTANPAQIGQPAAGLGYVRKPFSEAAILAAAKLAEQDAANAANDDLRPIERDLLTTG